MRRLPAVLVLLVVSACGGGGEEPATSAPPSAAAETSAGGAEASVDIVDFAFEPVEVEVAAGGTVTWTYGEDGNSIHTVSFSGGEESGDLNPGDTYEQTFAEAGEFDYVCFFHPSMTGTVTVSE